MKRLIPLILLIITICAIYIYKDREFNTYTTTEPVESLEVSSLSDNQVCDVSTFDLSSIWITINYKSGKKEQVTLSKEMLSRRDFDKLHNSGNHKIKVNIGKKSISLNLFLYDQNNLKNQKIYYYDNDSLNYVQANSVYEIDAPKRDNLYFYNWFSNEERTIRYEDNNSSNIVKLYAKFTDEVTYRVRFFHQDMLIYEEYVKKGGYATPPLMSSFDNLKFIGWDKSFSNVQEDLDVHSIYALPGSKVVYYNYDDSYFFENTISEEFVLEDPILPDYDGYIFKGWVKVKNIKQNIIEARPIFQKEQFEVKFYKWRYYYDSYSDAEESAFTFLELIKDLYLDYSWSDKIEFLYSTWVTAGESVSCNCELDGYKKMAYSIGKFQQGFWQEQSYTTDLTISNVTNSMEVCVLYKVQRFYSLTDSNTGSNRVYKVPFDANPLYYVYSGQYVQWVKKENDIYEICPEGDESFPCITEEYGRIIVDFNYFCADPVFHIGNKLNQYVAYEWYYDEDKTRKIEDYSKLKIGTTVYGKQIDPQLYADESCFSFSKTVINGVEGYRAILKDPFCINKRSVVVPEEYDSLPVIELSASSYVFVDYIYLSKNVMNVYADKKVKIYTDEDSPYFYSEDGNLFTKSNLATYINEYR